MGKIHKDCLREWLHSKRQVYDGFRVRSYFWKSLECELCKEPFERKMRSTLFNIMEFELPNGQGVYAFGKGDDYMVMESINSMPAKVVHVFDLRYDEFKIGRSPDTDMKVADISVSRLHSFIRVQKRQLILEDNGSKFGTQIKIQRPLPILASTESRGNCKSTLVQVGRTLLFLKVNTAARTRFVCQGVRTQAIDVDGSDAFLRLRKDKLSIPKEFYLNLAAEGDLAFVNEWSKPDIPLLKLPKNAADEWRQKLIIERQKNQKPPSPSPTPSDKFSLSEIQSEARSSIKIMSKPAQPRVNYLRSDDNDESLESGAILSERRHGRLNLSSAAPFSIHTPTS